MTSKQTQIILIGFVFWISIFIFAVRLTTFEKLYAHTFFMCFLFILSILQHETKPKSGDPDSYQQNMISIRNTVQGNNYHASITSASTSMIKRVEDNKNTRSVHLKYLKDLRFIQREDDI